MHPVTFCAARRINDVHRLTKKADILFKCCSSKTPTMQSQLAPAQSLYACLCTKLVQGLSHHAVPLRIVLGACAPHQGIVQLCHHTVVYLPTQVLQQCTTSISRQDDWITKVWFGSHLFGVYSDLQVNSSPAVKLDLMLQQSQQRHLST